jgi:hypothetical protein
VRRHGGAGELLIDQALSDFARDGDRSRIARDVLINENSLVKKRDLLGELLGIGRPGERGEILDLFAYAQDMLACGLMRWIVLQRELSGSGDEDTTAPLWHLEPVVQRIKDAVQPRGRVVPGHLDQQAAELLRLGRVSMLQHGEHQVVLAGKVVVEGLLADPGRCDDLVQADTMEAASPEEEKRCVDQLLTCVGHRKIS